MGAGHVAMSEGIFPFEAVFQGIKKKFQSLGEKPDSDWNDDDNIIFPVHG